MSFRATQIRHNRILDLRKKIVAGWTIQQLHDFCKTHLDVARVTAISYIDEAAEPYRKKYWEKKV